MNRMKSSLSPIALSEMGRYAHVFVIDFDYTSSINELIKHLLFPD